MKRFLLFLFLPIATVVYSQDFAVDDFLVRWTIMGVGNTELRVMKTQDATFINIYRSNGITSAAARMSGDDAVLVAEALMQTQQIFSSQEDATDNVSESVTTGNFEVTFRTSVFNGFSVVIQEIDRFNDQYNDRYSTNAVTLPLEEAIGIQQDLAKANELIEFLDAQVSL